MRRESYLAGFCEEWRPYAGERIRSWLAMTKLPDGPRRLLQAMTRVVDHASGALHPTYDYLQAVLGCSRDSVARWLKDLRERGLIAWVRRFVRDAEGGIRQTSNAYRLLVPEPAGLPWQAPIPDDHAHAQGEREAAQRAMALDAGPLGEALKRLGAAIGLNP